MNDKPANTRIIYVREGAVQSMLSDLWTFGLLAGITHLNFTYWGGRWYLTLFIVFLWLVYISGRAQAKKREFWSREDVIKTLQDELKEEKKS